MMLAKTEDLVERWVNPATLRGAALVLAGMLILGFPDASTFLTAVVASGGLIVVGITDIWAEIRSAQRSFRGLALGLGLIAAGVAMVLLADETLSVVTRILAVVIGVRGILTTFRGIASRQTNTSWLFDLIRGLFFVALAVIVFFIPDALISALIVVGGIVVIIVGGVMISYGISNPDERELRATELGGLVRRWADDRDLGDSQREELVDSLYFEPPDAFAKQRGFWTLLVLSVVIATLGVLADSPAVVIGAMLVAPLMTPIMGVSAAIVNGWMHRVSRSFATVAGGVAVSIAVAWIVAAWTPHLVPLASNSQILSRTSPTMIDLMIAIAAGAAGAYATVDKRVSSSITGVAIAVALVPPLGVVGVMLEAGLYPDAWGAFLLFLTNFVCIILAAISVFLIMGLAPMRDLRQNRDKTKTVITTVGLGALIIIVPLAFTSEGILASATRQSQAREVTEEWIESEPGLSIARIEIVDSSLDVAVTGEGDIPSIVVLETSLEDALATDVTVVVEYFPSVVISSEDR